MPADTDGKNKVLSVIGLTVGTSGAGAIARNALIDACIAYGKYDNLGSELVQIGPRCPYTAPHKYTDFGEPWHKLRAGSSLKNFVKREFLQRG